MASTSITNAGVNAHAMGANFPDDPGMDDASSGGMLLPVRLGVCIKVFRTVYLQALQLKVERPRDFKEAHPRETFPYGATNLRTLQGTLPKQSHCSVLSDGNR